MKYIRTKDGRIVEYGFFNNYEYIRGADTIEELCDCFVSVQVYKDEVADFDVYYSHGRNDFRDWFGEEIAEGCDIYGAINIDDKGLIYVAKMNDKGELELL